MGKERAVPISVVIRALDVVCFYIWPSERSPGRPQKPTVLVGKDKKNIGGAAADMILEEAKKSIARSGRFTIAFSGGSLPKIVGPSLVEKKIPDADKWFVFFSDERCVELDSGDSNFKGVDEHVLTPLKIPKDNVFTIDTENYGDPEKAASLYEEQLVKFFGDKKPSFDLILLGMGPDGHTCSLFPDHELLSERKKLIASIKNSPKPPAERITFTYPVLEMSKAIAFVCTGGGKSSALKTVIEGAENPGKQLPSGRINAKKILWYVDEDAAKELKNESISSKI